MGSVVVARGLQSAGSVVVAHRLSCSAARGITWDLPGQGLEPESPALAGRFLTTAPPGKPLPGSLKAEKSETGSCPRERGGGEPSPHLGLTSDRFFSEVPPSQESSG